MREPGDRVRLARPGRVLHQVVRARPRAHGRRLRASAPRPTGGSAGRSIRAPSRFSTFDPSSASRHGRTGRADRARRPAARPAPTGTRCDDPSGFGGFPAPPVVAEVERQELRPLPREPRRHRHLLRVDREVHERPRPSSHVRRVTVRAVLRHRVLDPLAGQRVLQLRRRHRDPVHEQAQVERVRRPARTASWRTTVSRFASYRSHQLRRQPVRGLEVRQPERDALIDDPVPQHVDRAAVVDLRRKPLEEAGLGIARSRRRSARQAAPTPSPASPAGTRTRAPGRGPSAGSNELRAAAARSRRVRAATPRWRPRTPSRSPSRRLRDVKLARHGGRDQRLPVLDEEIDLASQTCRDRARRAGSTLLDDRLLGRVAASDAAAARLELADRRSTLRSSDTAPAGASQRVPMQASECAQPRKSRRDFGRGTSDRRRCSGTSGASIVGD